MATHNRNYGNLVPGRKVVEERKWGVDTARERYGSPQSPDIKPRDMSQPQGCGEGPFDQRPDHSGLPRPFNDCRPDWRNGFGKGDVETSENMPTFDSLRPRGQEPPSPKPERHTNVKPADLEFKAGSWLRDGGKNPFSGAKR